MKTQVAEFEKLSERNAKHLYIERCQANPGYDCSFFNVKVPSSGRFKRAPVAKQLMGINNKRIVFLDEKTKVSTLMSRNDQFLMYYSSIRFLAMDFIM